MGVNLIRKSVRARFTIQERGHACAILAGDFKSEFTDLMDCLDALTLTTTHISTPGGNRSTISRDLDSFFFARGWTPKAFDTRRPVIWWPAEVSVARQSTDLDR